MRHAEHYAENRTSLHGLDQETLFFDLPLTSQLGREKKVYVVDRPQERDDSQTDRGRDRKR